MNWITIFAHKRPECLYLCLESLMNCRRIGKYSVYLAANEDSSPEIPAIAKEMLTGLNYEIGIRPGWWLANRANGEATKAGMARSDEYGIFLGEDETLSKDYLEMIESIAAANTDQNLLSVSGRGISVPNMPTNIDPVECMIKMDFFMGISCTMFKEPFDKYVKQYYIDDYYNGEVIKDGERYHYVDWMANTFPEYPFNHSLTLDGLTVRISLRHGLYSLVSLVPRSHEIGFFGSHITSSSEVYKKLFENKTLKEKVDIMRDLINSGKIKELFGDFASQYKELDEDHGWKNLFVKDSVFDIKNWRLSILDDQLV